MGGGGRGRSRTQRKHFSRKRENVWRRNSGRKGDGWESFITQNAAFEEYYKAQGTVAPGEWDAFVGVLRTPLPAAFRINSSTPLCDVIRARLENGFLTRAPLIDLRPLAWYPRSLAWQSAFSRMELRKTPSLERFHEFLKVENEVGNITRQQAVSMVPPLFLDVRSHHSVLDMCAAPGSKTFQLLEIIHQSCESGSLPTGMVVANDSDVQRCNLLIHQMKRMSTANLIVTNTEAQAFPFLNSDEIDSGLDHLAFDRVLCDVPCSGDGTLRKAPDIWRKWTAGTGNGFHPLQIQIAMRGLALLGVGGRMVYSTCSMNPIENEAVVAELLRRCEDSIRLVDVSSELPQLIRRSGLKNWKVRDKCAWYSSYAHAAQNSESAILHSMFPFSHGDCPFPLDRCVRIVPHDQNSGAFFVAVFHKLSPVKQRDDLSGNGTINPPGNSAATAGGKRRLPIQGRMRGIDPVVFLRDETVINSIRSFYGIGPSFPLEGGRLVTRSVDAENVKKIYYISKSVKDVLHLNFAAGQPLKIASVGLKMFERQSSKDDDDPSTPSFRISSEGLPLILPHLTKQVLPVSLKDLNRLLRCRSIKFSEFDDGGFREKAINLALGSCVVILEGSGATGSDPVIAIGCWKGRSSLSVMVTAVDCKELFDRLGLQEEPDGPCSPGRLDSAVHGNGAARSEPEPAT